MKNLYLIGGPMGVGKTAVGQSLKKQLSNAVFLDGDWCWDANPFQITEETKEMVMGNIGYLLNRFLGCSAYENIIFCWVMQEQSIVDHILEGLDTAHCTVKVISLLATEHTLSERIGADVEKGIRTIDVLARSLARLPLYFKLNSIKIQTDGKTVDEIAAEIRKL